MISLDSGKELWVSFRYERLHNICYWCGCLTHDDRDCEQWVELEGSFSTESQQFGPWIRASPFFPLRKNVIKVPGFHIQRGKDSSTTPTPPMGKPSVVVVRTGKPSLEVIRSEKESIVNGQQGNKEADSQENNSHDSRSASYNSGILRNLNLKSTDLGETRSAEEIFEERIEEIDKELKSFDPTITTTAKNIAATSKENLLESLSLTDDQSVYTQTSHAQQPLSLSPVTRAPLSVIDENTVKKIERVATWKRLNRTEMGTNVDMEDIVGEKRRGDSKDGQSELLKKRKVS